MKMMVNHTILFFCTKINVVGGHFQIMGVIVVNTKTYEEGTGKNAVSLAHIMEQVGKEYGVQMVIAVQPCDVYRVAQQTSIPVFSQHMDAISYGSNTGWTLPHAIKEAGGAGTLLNHSEHRMKLEDIAQARASAKSLGMKVIICASDVPITRAVASLNPEYVAIEPPELIGGDISVTSAQPDIVRDAVDAVRGVNPDVAVLCGAGIKNGKDVAKAAELGAQGILVASGVVKARDQASILAEMAKAMVP